MKRTLSMMSAVLVAAAVGLSAPAAYAAAPDVRPGRPVYLALGDSLAAGQQSVAPTRTFENTTARWKASGFVAQFGQTLRDELDCRPDRPRNPREGCPRLQVVNLARTGLPGVPGSGVTTSTVLAEGDQLDRALAILAEQNGDASTRNDVEVISLTVGGNDLFGPAVAGCVTSPNPSATCAPTLTSTFTGFAARYAEILGTLRAAAGPDVVILTTTYYNPLPFCSLGAANPVGSTALGNFVLEGGDIGLGRLDAGFNDLIRGISAQHGATVVDTFGVLGAGDFVGGEDCLHPDAEGHAKIADAFAASFPG